MGEGEPKAEALKPMSRKQLAAAVQDFVKGETLMNITYTNGRVEQGVVFDGYSEENSILFFRRGRLHFKGQGGKWPASASAPQENIASVREAEASA